MHGKNISEHSQAAKAVGVIAREIDIAENASIFIVKARASSMNVRVNTISRIRGVARTAWPLPASCSFTRWAPDLGRQHQCSGAQMSRFETASTSSA